MPDVSHIWGNDLTFGPTGDLVMVDYPDLATQRIIRRLMTRGYQIAGVNVAGETGEYIWHPEYGAGVPQRIGQAASLSVISSVINSQILQEASVAKAPPPSITVTPILNGVIVAISYTDANTGKQTRLSFNVNQ